MFDVVRAAVMAVGPAEVRVTKSQVAFSHRRGFAWAWTPDRYLGAEVAPLVLSVSLDRLDVSRRWKEVVRVPGDHWMHHLELRDASEVDAEVAGWLAEAWEAAR
ncbi:MAG: hypothetical protein AMXMBFR23_17770 [Chloroflexota bacterium]